MAMFMDISLLGRSLGYARDDKRGVALFLVGFLIYGM